MSKQTGSQRVAKTTAKRDAVAKSHGAPSWNQLGTAAANGNVEITVTCKFCGKSVGLDFVNTKHGLVHIGCEAARLRAAQNVIDTTPPA